MSEQKITNSLPAVQNPSNMNTGSALDFYFSAEKFDHIQRVAMMFSKSSLVPDAYRGVNNLGNCIIAIELASRIKMSPFMAMQNLNTIKGKPSWSSVFLIAALNTCGRFKPLKFKMEGKIGTMERTCLAYTSEIDSDEILEGPIVSMEMAKKEGWIDKNGSKWQTMPELMLRYRAASFFSRLYAPEISMGMQTTEEIKDVDPSTLSETEYVIDEIPELEIEGASEIVEETKEENSTVEELPSDTPASPDEYNLRDPLGVVAAIKSIKTISEINKFKKEHKDEILAFSGKEDKLIQDTLKEQENILLKANK